MDKETFQKLIDLWVIHSENPGFFSIIEVLQNEFPDMIFTEAGDKIIIC